MTDLINISGIGAAKGKCYGAALLAALKADVAA